MSWSSNVHSNYKSLRMRCTGYLSVQLKHITRPFTTRSSLSAKQPFSPGPAPPRLPESDQRLYEKLQKASTGAFSTPKATITINQSPGTPSTATEAKAHIPPQINQSPHNTDSSFSTETQRLENINAKVTAQGGGEELHPDVRRGARPEFEGERNPKTGEVGGPKNEPLRWGGGVDWSYNGRVTDF